VLVSLAEDQLLDDRALRASQTARQSAPLNVKHVLIDFGSMGYKHSPVGRAKVFVAKFPDDGANSTMIDCCQEGPAHGCDSGGTSRQFGR
jgi:hypothetical protein